MNFLTSADAINGDALSASSLTNLAFLGLYMTAPTSFYIPNCFAISDSSLADVKVNDIGSFNIWEATLCITQIKLILCPLRTELNKDC